MLCQDGGADADAVFGSLARVMIRGHGQHYVGQAYWVFSLLMHPFHDESHSYNNDSVYSITEHNNISLNVLI